MSKKTSTENTSLRNHKSLAIIAFHSMSGNKDREWIIHCFNEDVHKIQVRIVCNVSIYFEPTMSINCLKI